MTRMELLLMHDDEESLAEHISRAFVVPSRKWKVAPSALKQVTKD